MGGTFLGHPWTPTDAKIKEIANKRGVSIAVVAIAWSLSKEYMTASILGASKIERVEEAVQAVNFELSKEEWESIGAPYEPKKVIELIR